MRRNASSWLAGLALTFMLASISPSSARGTETKLLFPQGGRHAYYSSESIEMAIDGLSENQVAQVQLIPEQNTFAQSVTITAKARSGVATFRLPADSLAPGKYQVLVNRHKADELTITSGIWPSAMLISQAGPLKSSQAGGDFILGNAFTFGKLNAQGQPALDPRIGPSPGMQGLDQWVAANLPVIVYMYWTGYVTHKPWGTQKSWANAAEQRMMRMYNFSTAQRLRSVAHAIHSVGPIDEPGLTWGSTPNGGMDAGYPTWDQAQWYKNHGWNFTHRIAAQSDQDWMRYVRIRTDVIGGSYRQAKQDIQTVWPGAVFAGDSYAVYDILDGCNPMNQAANDIPTTHVFTDWGFGKLGTIGAIYVEKSDNPTRHIAHAMNGQLTGDTVGQPNMRDAYRLMMNALLASGLSSNWWLNYKGMSAEDLASIDKPVVRLGSMFKQFAPANHHVAILWSFTELAMREKAWLARTARQKQGEPTTLSESALPKSLQVKSGELSANSYLVGRNYRNTIIMGQEALTRAGYPTSVVAEQRLADGVPKNYRALVVLGQHHALPAKVMAAIAAFTAHGGKVIVDPSTTVHFPGEIITDAKLAHTGLRWQATGAKAQEKGVSPRQASYWGTNYFVDQPARDAVKPMQHAMQQAGVAPVLTTDSPHLGVERHVGGDGALIMVINAYAKLPTINKDQKYPLYNYAAFKTTYTLHGIPAGAAVYEISGTDWRTVRRVQNPDAPIAATFAPGAMKLYLIAPHQPAGLDLKASATDGRLHLKASLQNLHMPWPLTVSVIDPKGKTLYTLHRATNDAGTYTETLPIGLNAPAGPYHVQLHSPVAHLAARATVRVQPGTVQPVSIDQPVRFFDRDAITKLLQSGQPIVVAYGRSQASLAKHLADELSKRGVPATAKPVSQVVHKAEYPRIWNPTAAVVHLDPTGKTKSNVNGKIDHRFTVTGHADGRLTITDASSVSAKSWKQPNSVVTVAGDGFVDYVGQDNETVYEAGVELYVDAQHNVHVLRGKREKVKTTAAFRKKWDRPWSRLYRYFGNYQLPPSLPEAYMTNDNLILLGDSGDNCAVRTLQASEILPRVVDRAYPGQGRALIQFAWSPFGIGKNIIFIGAADQAGLNAGINALIKLPQTRQSG